MKGTDFYFQLIHNPRHEPAYTFLITPKGYYDIEGALSDESGIADGILPEGFGELMESTYEFVGTSEVGRQMLIDIGMTEIDFGFNNPVAPAENNEEEDYQEEEASEEDYSTEKYEQDIDYLLQHGEKKPFDYKETSTDKLFRHLKIMLMSESFEEAAKIRDELTSRGVTDF